MTDDELVDGLLALSSSENLTDEESDLVAEAARVLMKKSDRKTRVMRELKSLNMALHDL